MSLKIDTKIDKEAVTQWIRKHKIMTAILVVLVVIGIAGSLGQSNSDTSSNTPSVQTPAAPSLSVGDTGYLYEKGSLTQAIEVTTTKDNLDQLISLAVAGDTLGMAKMVMDEQAFLVDPGTQVKVIDISFPDAYEVRVLSGQYYSQSGWLPGEFVSQTKINTSKNTAAPSAPQAQTTVSPKKSAAAATNVPQQSSPTTTQAPMPAPQTDNQNISPVSTETVSQINAVRKAQSYLDYAAFSHDGLVAQLEYDQFSPADALYGADNSGANWNEQAAAKAKSYMSYSAFSRGSLIAQLEYDKFTQAQAEYGANAVGL